MSIVYIGIGSNLGDREGNCKQALRLLQANGILKKNNPKCMRQSRGD